MARQKRQVFKKNHQRTLSACCQTMWQALKLVLIALGVSGACYGAWQAGNYLYRLPYFEVKQVVVKGNRYLSDEQVRRLSGVRARQNIFAVELPQVSQNLHSHPYIKQVMVERKFPQTIRIKVQERKGVALLKAPAAYYLLDAEGVVLENVGLRNKRCRPVLEGVSLQPLQVGEKISRGSGLLGFLKARGLLRDFALLDVSSPANPRLTTRREGIKINLGQGDWEKKMKRFAQVYQELRARKNSVKSVDLRYWQMAVVKEIAD